MTDSHAHADGIRRTTDRPIAALLAHERLDEVVLRTFEKVMQLPSYIVDSMEE